MGPMTANKQAQPSTPNQEKGTQADTTREVSTLNASLVGAMGAELRKAAMLAMLSLASTAIMPGNNAAQEKTPSAPTTPSTPTTPKETLTKAQKEVGETLEVVSRFLRANGATVQKISVMNGDELSLTLQQLKKSFESVPYHINGRASMLEHIRIFESALKDHPFNPKAEIDSATAEFTKSINILAHRLLKIGEWREPAKTQESDKDNNKKGTSTPEPLSAETIIDDNLVRVQNLLESQGRPLPAIDLESPHGTDKTLERFGVALSIGNRSGALNRSLRVALVDLRNALDKNPKDLEAAKRFHTKVDDLLKDQ